MDVKTTDQKYTVLMWGSDKSPNISNWGKVIGDKQDIGRHRGVVA